MRCAAWGNWQVWRRARAADPCAACVVAASARPEHATESEVIRDGLRVLMARDRAIENWLSQSVGSAYDALKASPARAVPMAKVRARLAAEHKKSVAKA